MSTGKAASSSLEEKFLEETDAEIEKLEPMKVEYDRLVALRARLTGGAARGKAPAARASGGSAPRARQGNRMEQFLGFVKAEPGISIPQLAVKMGIEANYLYRIRAQAEKQGKISVADGKITAIDAAA